MAVPQNFFAFKGYFPFGSSKLNALQNNVRQRMSSNPHIFENQQEVIDRAWTRDWSIVTVLSNWSTYVEDIMYWYTYSALLDSTLFVHITVGGDSFMLFRTISAYTDLTKHLARVMDYYVCGVQDGAVTVLSADEWESVQQHYDMQFVAATLIQGSVLVDSLRRSSYIPTMPKGYFDVRYLQESQRIRDTFHNSHAIITEIVMQKYDFELPAKLFDTPFLFDKFPKVASITERQTAEKTLCMLYTTTHGYYVLKNAPPKMRVDYTNTFSEYNKVFMVEGTETLLDEVLHEYFGSNKYVDQIQGFIDSDRRNEVNPRIKQFLREAQTMVDTGVSALLHVHPHIKAACYLFLLELNKSYDRFAHESIKIWMNGLDINLFNETMVNAVPANNGFAESVFFTYLLYGIKENSAFYTWFMANGQLPKNRTRSLINVHRQFNVLGAPQSSLFVLQNNLQTHVAALGAYIFTILGVRIGGFVDTTNRDIIEKSTAACIEAVVAMEGLFPRVGASTKWLSTPQECGLLNDCRLWIAAWLFAFKIIIDRQVSSQRIDAILWSIKSKTLNNSAATNAEKDVALFIRLFGLAYINVPYVIGGLMPTLGDLRRYVEKHAIETAEINFTNVYDAQPDKLHWLTSEFVPEEYTSVGINYSDDLSASVYGSVAFNDQILRLESTGHILRKIFATFLNGGEVEQKLKAFAERVRRKFTKLYQTNQDDYRQIVQQLTNSNRTMAFAHTPTTQKKIRKLSKIVKKFSETFGQQIENFTSDELLYVTWLVHSAIVRNQYATREVSHTVTVVSSYTTSPPNTPGGGQHFSVVYNSLINPEVHATLSMFDLAAAERVLTNKSTEAALAIGISSHLLDVPMSFNGKVLAKAGPALVRHVEGFPIVKRFFDEEEISRQYNSYSDLVCRYNSTTDANELLETIINTVAVQYRSHFKLPTTAYGGVMTENRFNQLIEHLQSVAETSDGYLARDILATLNSVQRVMRLVDDITISATGRGHQGLQHYLSISTEVVSNQAVASLVGDVEMYGNLGETSYGISHYFKYANLINADYESMLLLRLLASNVHGHRSAFEFYAPIRGYIHSSLAGMPKLPEKKSSKLYDLVGNYLTSRRGLSAAHHQSSEMTGYSPVIDAFTRNGGMYQSAKALEAPKDCAISFSWSGREHILASIQDDAEVFGTLAGEVTRIEFNAYFVRPVHKDIQDIATQQFIQTVKEQILSVNELYPVDEYAWFQFVDAVPAPAIPSKKLFTVDLSTVTNPPSKRARTERQRKNAAKSKRRIGAAISPDDPLYERFTTLKLRVGIYKSLRNDSNDPNFRRDFVDFYLRAILSHRENTDDVFLGNTADYAACIRYYGTPIVENRSAIDLNTVNEFFAQPQDIKIMPSSEFPHWRVAVFQRSTNSVLVAHSHDDIDEVFSAIVEGASYTTLKVPTIGDPQYNFFAMLRYIEVVMTRSNILDPLSTEDARHIVDDLTGYFAMLDLALDALTYPGMQPATNEPDWRHRVHVQRNLSDEDRLHLQATGRDAYLSDNIVVWFSSWLHLSHSRNNGFPHRQFEIESPMLAQVISTGEHVIKQKTAPTAQLYLYPWFDRRRRHYFLVVIYFPLRIIFCIDSMVDRTRGLLLNYAMRISQGYRSTKNLTKSDWTAIVPKRVPRQRHGFQSCDYTMANIEYLVSWFMNNREDFVETMRLIDTSGEVYSFDQVDQIHAKVATFRSNLLILADIASQSELPTSEPIDEEPEPAGDAELVHYDDEEYNVPTTDDNVVPALFYEHDVDSASYSDEFDDHYVRVACRIIGYEISAQRHGNALRYVRYSSQGNAAFVKRERNPDHNPDERQLSYWELRSLGAIDAGTEIKVQMPPGDIWKRFLLTGYPYEIDAHASHATMYRSDVDIVGPTFGVGARIMPLVSDFGSNVVFGASPLPLYRPRMAFD